MKAPLKQLKAITGALKETLGTCVEAFVLFNFVYMPMWKDDHCKSCALLHDATHCITYPCSWPEVDGLEEHSPRLRDQMAQIMTSSTTCTCTKSHDECEGMAEVLLGLATLGISLWFTGCVCECKRCQED